MKPIFLLSYSHLNKKRVEKLRKTIELCGAEALQDELSIEPGDPIPERVRDLVRRATHLLVLWSPAGEQSLWVSFEMGMAWALERNVWCLVLEPGQEPPKMLAHLKYLTSTQELQREIRKLVRPPIHGSKDHLTAVERYARHRLFFGPTGHASAVRLFGADDEFFAERYTRNIYRHEPYVSPLDLLPHRNRILQQKEEEAKKRGALLFNGPNTRLLEWRANPITSSDIATERRTLDLVLGPVGWFDYEGLNEAFREQTARGDVLEACLRYVGLEAVVENGSVSTCQLSNIVDTGSILLTRDGFFGYQKRGERVSAVPHSFTTGVAENINRHLDDADPNDSKKLFNPNPDGPLPDEACSNDYIPRGVPHPFAAVRRGLGEEVSRLLFPSVGPNAIKLMSVSFDLDVVHPNLLFLIAVDSTVEEVLRVARAQPGRDYFEGHLRFVRADAAAFAANADIAAGKWVPAGKAALFRALELVEALRSRRALTFGQAFELLRDGT